MFNFKINTESQVRFIDITSKVHDAVVESGVKDGICVVYIPHTTAGVTINENADPDVVDDINKHLNEQIPLSNNYKHSEGNSAAHIKASLMGSSATVIVKNNQLVLGTWQSIFFTEFDGPRNRTVIVKVISE